MAKSPKTRKLPRSTQSRPTAHFVTGEFTHSIQDLRAFARKDMDQLVSHPALADRALQIAFSHKDVHLATKLLDAGARPCPKPRHNDNAFAVAVNAAYATSADVRQVMEDIIDRMLEMGPQWVHCTAAKILDRSSPERWHRSLVGEIQSQPLSSFHANTLEHCLEVPEAVKALLDRGAVWGSAPGVESELRLILLDSEYPLDVLASFKHVAESSRPNHAPGSDRLAARRRFDWEALLRINPLKKAGWFASSHRPVLDWTNKHLQVDMAHLMLLECASSSPAISSWTYYHSDRTQTLATVTCLVESMRPRSKRQSTAAETIARLAMGIDVAGQHPEVVGFQLDLEDLVVRMVDKLGFSAPDLSALPNPPDHGRLYSFCMSRMLREKVGPAPKAPVAPVCTATRRRF